MRAETAAEQSFLAGAEGADPPPSISEIVAERARRDPSGVAFVTSDGPTTWADYDCLADTVATGLRDAVGAPGSRVALLLPDTAGVHAALCGAYRAGRVACAIGARSGAREIAHIIDRTAATVLIIATTVRGRPWQDIVDELQWCGDGVLPVDVLVVDERVGAVTRHRLGVPRTAADPVVAEPFTTSDVTILNSTSGTTGLPKVVAHNERKWAEFARQAMSGGRIGPDDVLCSVVPAPFGFGLWSAHFLPALLGVPVVVTPRFDVDELAMLIERERVTVLCCVTTQFKMLLRSETGRTRDLSSLRILYTGGEPVPYDAAREFEERTGAAVLQFYGSNEAGAVSQTTVDDDVETRLRTCGRVLASTQIRLLDDAGADCAPGDLRRGQPAVRGPLLSDGYWDDPAATAELYTADGWMLLGDVVEIDGAGRVRVVGRKADFIIRGGKNISVVEIEEIVRGHGAVSDVAVVGVPDDIYGERVCAVVVLDKGGELDTDSLAHWLKARGVTKEYLPEYVVATERLELGPGGKTDRRAAQAAAVHALGFAAG